MGGEAQPPKLTRSSLRVNFVVRLSGDNLHAAFCVYFCQKSLEERLMVHMRACMCVRVHVRL